MTGAEHDLADERRHRFMPRRRRTRALLAVLLVVVLLGLALWLERMPVARHFVDGELARRRVPARYEITDLGLGRQRLTNVVIGDPATPDLTADWIETQIGIGFSGPTLVGIRAGHVRLRGRLAGGRISLGAIDRLLPAPGGDAPLALPRLALDVRDLRMDLSTPYGGLVARVRGAGRLDGGFAGRIVVADAPVDDGGGLRVGRCRIGPLLGDLAIRVDARRPRLTGKVGASSLACGGLDAAAVRVDLDARLGEALDRWSGNARLTGAGIAAPNLATTGPVAGTVSFSGDAHRTAGNASLVARSILAGGWTARTASLTGHYAFGDEQRFDGRAALAGMAAPRAMRRSLARAAGTGAGTPVAPLATALTVALDRALAAADGTASVSVRRRGAIGGLRVAALRAQTRSGARLASSGDGGLTVDLATGRMAVDARLTTGGGGLPTASVAITKRAADTGLTGTALLASYAAGGARLALAPVRFTATPHGNTRVRTTVDLSGPLGDGRIERLVFPVDALWDGRRRLAINTDCTSVSVDRLAVAGLVLDPATLRLCPTGVALVTLDGGRLGGGARIGATRLAGRLGATPLTLAAAGAELGLTRRGFTVDGVDVRLGGADRVTRLSFANLAGGVAGGRLHGRFAGGAGQIANVPLLLADATGDWRLAGGALSLTGALKVSDAQTAAPRFKPMAARNIALTLANGAIVATGTLHEPTTGTRIADLRIDHALGPGTGHADLTVPGLAFAKGFQPDLLTPVTFGVIADVKGTVAGSGRIDWSPAGVTSTGTFSTPGTDLAAAFGPVTGIAGTIRFTDLLALESAPGQVATVKAINPGIVVENGRVTFQTLPGTRVQVEGATWPFAGGTLTLAPTLLDFAADKARRLTFKVEGMAADRFLQQFDFKNLDATGVFDGELPMVFDADGGRIENGRLVVRQGGGGIAYNGEVSDKNLGFWGNLAFGALKSLRYRNLSVVLNGPLAGEMVTEVRFAGISQGEGARSNFLIRRLQKLPFVFNIRIKAPFRGLLDSAQSFYDPSRLIQRNLPTLIEQQKRDAAPSSPTPVQPPATKLVP